MIREINLLPLSNGLNKGPYYPDINLFLYQILCFFHISAKVFYRLLFYIMRQRYIMLLAETYKNLLLNIIQRCTLFSFFETT
jgi:hypothetical protein